MTQYNNAFWQALDMLVSESKIVIDRPKGSRHPKYPNLLYPVDYGYLENTSSMDGSGIDVWKGADGDSIDAIICTVDLMKKDSEIKILIGCSEDEKQLILDGIVDWYALNEICERDRAFLWAAGLYQIEEFAKELGSWGDDISYPHFKTDE